MTRWGPGWGQRVNIGCPCLPEGKGEGLSWGHSEKSEGLAGTHTFGHFSVNVQS